MIEFIVWVLFTGVYVSALGRSLLERDIDMESCGECEEWLVTYVTAPFFIILQSFLVYMIGIRLCIDSNFRDSHTQQAVQEYEQFMRSTKTKDDTDGQ